MKLTELQAKNGDICDVYQQAFKETNRLGHANETEIKAQLDDVRFRLANIAADKVTPAEYKQVTTGIAALYEDAIREEGRKGPIRPEQIHKVLSEQPSAARLLFKQQEVKAAKQECADIRRCMKKRTIAPHIAEANQKWSEKQPELGFHDLDLFRGVPAMIDYRDPKTNRIVSIPYAQSFLWQRQASYELEVERERAKGKAWSAASNTRLKARKDADNALAVLAKEINDLPAAELWAEAQRRKSNHSNGN